MSKSFRLLSLIGGGLLGCLFSVQGLCEENESRIGVSTYVGVHELEGADDVAVGGGFSYGYGKAEGWGVEGGYDSFAAFNIPMALFPVDMLIDEHAYTYLAPTYTWQGESLYFRAKGGLTFWQTEYQVGVDPESNSLDREARSDSGTGSFLGLEAGFLIKRVELGLHYTYIPTDRVTTKALGLGLNYRF